jgi:hypothetical protein
MPSGANPNRDAGIRRLVGIGNKQKTWSRGVCVCVCVCVCDGWESVLRCAMWCRMVVGGRGYVVATR